MNYTNYMNTEDLRERRRMKKQRARKRKLLRIRLGIFLFLSCLILCTGISILFQQKTQDPEVFPVNGTGALAESKSETDIEWESETDKLSQILDNPDLYPERLQELAVKNPEAIDFVLEYPEKSDLPPADTIGEVPGDGTIPLLLQWDERWGYAPYGSDTIVAVSGCGPTCIAMVACGLTGDNTITPAVVASYASEAGFLTDTNDTSWELMTVGCQHFGIYGQTLTLNETVMADTLNAGYPIICSMSPGIFTTTGHFIVLTGYEDGYFTVNDPASQIRSETTYTYAEFQDQIKNMWFFTPMITSDMDY